MARVAKVVEPLVTKFGAQTVECSTKAQVDAALKKGDIAKIIAGVMSLTFSGTDRPTLIVLPEASVSIVTWETSAPRIETWGTSAPSIVTWGTSAPRIETWGTSAPRIETWETSAPSIVTRETSAPSIVTRGTSAPRIVTRETSAPSIVTWGTSAPRIETWGTSAPRIETWGTSAPRIVTRETSAPRIETWETSAPSIETWGTSAPRIETWETSAPSIDARSYSMVRIRGTVAGTATDNVSLHIQGDSAIVGGKQTIINLVSARDWCDFYGARIDGDCAIVYKAVGKGYVSAWGATYEPGTMPKDDAWNGLKRECAKGGGLNFSPTPRHTHEFVTSPAHYLECRVKLADMVVHFGGSYPQKICAPEVVAPLVEVDVDGLPIAETSK
jgi:hypothetical protein